MMSEVSGSAARSFVEIRGEAHDLTSWKQLISGGLPPFQRVENAPDSHFRGRLHRQIIDGISAHLITIETAHHEIHRTRDHIRSTDEPLYVVMFQIAGQSEFSQAGATATLRPRQFTISTTEVPFSWVFPGDFTVFMLRFPQAMIDAAPQALLPLTGQALTEEDAFTRLFAPFAESVLMNPDLLRGSVGRRIARNLVDLFTTCAISVLESRTAVGPGASGTQFLRITEWIGQHLRDSDLSSARIAHENFISLRKLQTLFQEHGTTVTSWVRERRLSEVRTALSLPSLALQSIGSIAQSYGFDDQAAFSRAFRATFAETPRQWRTRALGHGASGGVSAGYAAE